MKKLVAVVTMVLGLVASTFAVDKYTNIIAVGGGLEDVNLFSSDVPDKGLIVSILDLQYRGLLPNNDLAFLVDAKGLFKELKVGFGKVFTFGTQRFKFIPSATAAFVRGNMGIGSVLDTEHRRFISGAVGLDAFANFNFTEHFGLYADIPLSFAVGAYKYRNDENTDKSIFSTGLVYGAQVGICFTF